MVYYAFLRRTAAAVIEMFCLLVLGLYFSFSSLKAMNSFRFSLIAISVKYSKLSYAFELGCCLPDIGHVCHFYEIFGVKKYRPFSVRYKDLLWVGPSGDRIPVDARFSAPFQAGPGAHPTSCTMCAAHLSRW